MKWGAELLAFCGSCPSHSTITSGISSETRIHLLEQAADAEPPKEPRNASQVLDVFMSLFPALVSRTQRT